MKVLFVNSIFPNSVEPNKGNFILKNLAAYPAEVEVKVIAPIPFLLESRRGQPGTRIPLVEKLQAGKRTIEVFHPRFILLPRNILRAIVPFLEYILMRGLLKKIYANWKYDLIHANFASPDGIAATILSKVHKIPLVITEHQADLAAFLKIGYLRKEMTLAYKQANKVICVSEHTAGIIHSVAPRLKNICVIPNGVDFTRFILHPKAAQPCKLIYIGYLIPHKGVQVLIEALSLLKNQNFRLQLSIVGAGTYLDELKKLCNKLNLEKDVAFLGEKTAEQVALLLSEHDVMVHPSFMESFGIVLVEALASGIPVVSTFNGGAESIIDAETGILVKPRDSLALAEGIKTLILNWDHYNPERIRALAEARFAIHGVAEQTIQVYRSVLCQV
ncbi:glycosyltransferase family 4 protein [Candidatus Cloacimonadaceae bacterium]